MTASLEELELATKLVAGSFNGPHCVEAAALMLEVGARLDFELEAHAVSLFAYNGSPTGSVATGMKGRAFGETFLARRSRSVVLGGEFEGGTPFQRHAGHMIVVSSEHSLLLDPTFSQFDQLGTQAVALFASEVRLRAGQFWQVSSDDLIVRYFSEDDFMELDFQLHRDASSGRADEIVRYISLRNS